MESRGEAQQMVVEGRAPDPRGARNAPEFVALLGVLKEASGLTYRELAQRADAVGDVLPRSTIANMLGRTSVPREELLAAFVRACGCGPEEVADWLAVRKELAVHGERAGTGEESGAAPEATAGHSSEPPTVPFPEPAPARRPRFRKVLAAAFGLVVLAAAAVTVTLLVRDDGKEATPVSGPVAGRTVQIRSVHSGFCLSEKRGSDSGRLYQVPCEQETIPSFSLKPLDGDAWRIVTDHPDYDLGCTGIWDGMRDAGAGLQDQECGKRGDAEEFLIEPVGRPVEGYRIRPAHTRLCVGAEGNSKDRGAKLVQTGCDGAGRGSLFSFDPVVTETAGG
ncbi:helix-turn-helix domain-containing protein [Streptomyces sp. NBC_00378]|uniref:helix-turn-helix domain-containing protein n=1 Tax=unclassified Streptomyces TaxID=2593676 RepID=UPI00225B9406|nr:MULTISPECIES: helix-turn-helix domain-containing protein [unclassified Streptomyces]MCX5109275.1 helix-turn-helix domain-containing protein [Streptomyces sp. NBC_00378]